MSSKQAIFETIADRSDTIPLCPRLHLFLKPSARILITIQFSGKNKTSISNWKIMERLKEWIEPDKFSQLSVVKTSSELIKFDAELADRSRLSTVLSRLCDRHIKFPGISHILSVNAFETKPDFPTRRDWDSYFRNSKDMNELNPGERPDTLHIENIPLEWLTEPGEKYPSENTLKKLFHGFGEVARVDLPAADPSRVNHGIGVGDVYIQFKDYSGFAKAMESLRGNKLAYITDTRAFIANIKVNFDKTKHMTLDSITKRHERHDRFMTRKKITEETERIKKEKEKRIQEQENKKKLFELEKKLGRRKLREEKRKGKRLKRLADQEADKMNQGIVAEERLLLKAQRKLQALNLLGELFSRIKLKMVSKNNVKKQFQSNSNNVNNLQFGDIELTFRQKMIKKWKPVKPKIFKNFDDYNKNYDKSSQSNDQNMNYNQGRDQSNWRSNNDKSIHQHGHGGRCACFMPAVIDPIINHGHKYHKYLQESDKEFGNDRSHSCSQSKKRKHSLSCRRSRSYSRSQSKRKNSSRSRSRSCTESKSTRSNSCSRIKSLVKINKSCSESRSHSRSKSKSHDKTKDIHSKHKHKKKSDKKKKKKHKKSKK